MQTMLHNSLPSCWNQSLWGLRFTVTSLNLKSQYFNTGTKLLLSMMGTWRCLHTELLFTIVICAVEYEQFFHVAGWARCISCLISARTPNQLVKEGMTDTSSGLAPAQPRQRPTHLHNRNTLNTHPENFFLSLISFETLTLVIKPRVHIQCR